MEKIRSKLNAKIVEDIHKRTHLVPKDLNLNQLHVVAFVVGKNILLCESPSAPSELKHDGLNDNCISDSSA